MMKTAFVSKTEFKAMQKSGKYYIHHVHFLYYSPANVNGIIRWGVVIAYEELSDAT